MGARGTRSAVELQRAQDSCALVRVHRRGHLEVCEGYVVAVGERWFLLASLDPAVVLDGYVALRLRDVREVEHGSTAAFVRAALTLREQWPPAPPPAPVALESTPALLASLRGHWPLVTVHPELDDPTVCHIGEVRRLGREKLHLREITPQATWAHGRGAFRFRRITRIDVGGRYEQALIQVATGADHTLHT